MLDGVQDSLSQALPLQSNAFLLKLTPGGCTTRHGRQCNCVRAVESRDVPARSLSHIVSYLSLLFATSLLTQLHTDLSMTFHSFLASKRRQIFHNNWIHALEPPFFSSLLWLWDLIPRACHRVTQPKTLHDEETSTKHTIWKNSAQIELLRKCAKLKPVRARHGHSRF